MTNSHRMCLNSDHKRYILKEFEELKDYGFKVKIKIKLLFRHCIQYFLEKSQDTYFYNHTFTYVCSLITVSLVTLDRVSAVVTYNSRHSVQGSSLDR